MSKPAVARSLAGAQLLDDVVDAPLEIRLTARSKLERPCGKGSYQNA
jgi:hypothetical protein